MGDRCCYSSRAAAAAEELAAPHARPRVRAQEESPRRDRDTPDEGRAGIGTTERAPPDYASSGHSGIAAPSRIAGEASRDPGRALCSCVSTALAAAGGPKKRKLLLDLARYRVGAPVAAVRHVQLARIMPLWFATSWAAYNPTVQVSTRRDHNARPDSTPFPR
jgi:hypothetical protein